MTNLGHRKQYNSIRHGIKKTILPDTSAILCFALSKFCADHITLNFTRQWNQIFLQAKK